MVFSCVLKIPFNVVSLILSLVIMSFSVFILLYLILWNYSQNDLTIVKMTTTIEINTYRRDKL